MSTSKRTAQTPRRTEEERPLSDAELAMTLNAHQVKCIKILRKHFFEGARLSRLHTLAVLLGEEIGHLPASFVFYGPLPNFDTHTQGVEKQEENVCSDLNKRSVVGVAHTLGDKKKN